ncbi:MAG: NAD-dependent epimerase/dehydratase family protein [Deltaproteobacteria bacterium]|nr:MAG: NAD-dependent epimerase/dehydratase family protein [Deltaproteobacteria bacterium]
MTPAGKRGRRSIGSGKRGKTRHVLVTGYPGFLGKRLVAHILKSEPETNLYLLVQEKFHEDANRYVSSFRGAKKRVRLFVGDIAKMHLGLSAEEVKHLARTVTDIYHLAAISYLGVADDYMWKVNVGGTRNVIDLAGECRRLGRLNHMSSCFVSGNQHGVVLEDELELGQSFRNNYERTKFEAEKAVRAAMEQLPVTIYRPSIVVGDSRTGEIGRMEGPYYLGLLLASSPATVPHPLPGDGTAPVHMVPVDYATEAVYVLSTDPAARGRCFHIVDPNPLAVRHVYNLLADRVGKGRSRVRVPAGLVKGVLRLPVVERYTRAYRQAVDYLTTMVFYSHSNTDELLGGRLHCPPFTTYVDRLIEYVQATYRARRDAQERDPLDG